LWLSNSMAHTQWIYESPDGGKTVYRRLANSTQRELVRKAPEPHSIAAHVSEIVAASETDQALSEMLDQLMVYWRLKHATTD
jgi:hypothetical protein